MYLSCKIKMKILLRRNDFKYLFYSSSLLGTFSRKCKMVFIIITVLECVLRISYYYSLNYSGAKYFTETG